MGKEGMTSLPVKGFSQIAGGRAHKGIVIEEKIRSLKSGIVHSAKTLDGLTDIGWKVGK